MKTSRIGFMIIGFIFCFIVTAVYAQAPLGTYVATTGQSSIKGKGAAAGGDDAAPKGRMKQSATTGAGAGNTITIQLASYSAKAELDQLMAVQNDPLKFLETLKTFNHGSIQISGKSIPINMASSRSVGGKYTISILTAKPLYGSGAENVSGKGASMGMIELTVDASGNGKGLFYSQTMVGLSGTGEATAKGGAGTSKATQLTSVSKQ
ncbi:MAG: hypothetical protein AB7S77_06420 [Desulfatirhabdiaceae bacterium]